MAVTAHQIEQATFRFRATLVVVFLWGLSLILPALHTRFDAGGGAQVLVGWQVLMSGWIALAALQLGWLANPLLVIMLVAWTADRFADRVARWSAVGLIVTTVGTIDLVLRADFYRLEAAGFGYWLWLMNNLAAAALVMWTSRRVEGIEA